MSLPTATAEPAEVSAARTLAARVLRDGGGGAALAGLGLADEDLPVPVLLAVAEECGRAGMLDVPGGELAQAAALVGTAAALLDMGARYAASRHAFGRPLARFQVQRHAFALAAARVAASRALTWRAAEHGDPLDCSCALAVAADAAWLAAETALQVHGGNGYSDEYEVSRRWTQVARVRARIAGTR